MTFVSGRQTINAQACADLVTLARQVQQVVEALGNPAPIKIPEDVERSPCGELTGNAFIRTVNGIPELVYVDGEGVCQTVPTSGPAGQEPIISEVEVDSAVAPNYTVKWISDVTGSGSGVSIPLYNPWGSVYTVGQRLLAVKITQGVHIGKYVAPPDREGSGGGDPGGGGGSQPSEPQLIRFELSENKTRAMNEVQAFNVADPNKSITLLDTWNDFFGLQSFEGYAWKNGNEYRILAMEGWTRLLLVSPASSSNANATIDCTVLEHFADSPFASRKPEGVNNQAPVFISSDIGFPKALSSHQYLAALRTDDNGTGSYYYEAVARVYPRHDFVRIRGTTTGAVTDLDTLFTINGIQPIIGEAPTSAQVSVYVEPNCKMRCSSGTQVFAVWNSAEDRWTNADAGNFLLMVKGLLGWVDNANQSLLHDANQNPEWRTDQNCP